MAALASTAVSLYPTGLGEAEYFPCGVDNRNIVTRRLKLVLTGQGGQTNTIGAAALGFDKLLQTSNLFDDSNNVGYPAVIDPVLNVILLLDGAAAPAPVDVTAAATYITVTGTVPTLAA